MRRAAALPLVLALLAGCERAPEPVPAPVAEFIVAAADSVFWIRSEADGIRVRGAPMVLAQVGGRFSEIYAADDDYSFYDAVFIGQRLFKRDLISGDSVQLVADTLMPLLARAYAAANPDERPLEADEHGTEDPRTVATADLLVLDVHGPWLSFEYRTDVDVIGGTSAHGARRGVIDLRTASPAPLDAIIGAAPARRAIAAARDRWTAMHDSLVLAADSAVAPVPTADRYAFDPRSFSLAVLDRALQVRFAVTQANAEEEATVLELDPAPVEPPAWFEALRGEYPIDERIEERTWPRDAFTLVGRPADAPRARVALALRGRDGTEWRLGSVPAPVLRVMWLEDSTEAPGTRAALTKAFNEASFYSGENRIVRHEPRGPIPGAALRPAVRPAARLHPAAVTPRRLPPAAPRRAAPTHRSRSGT
ncbi:MAG: hypothetical protein K1X31_10585 [Gemmatimonadaceae bacterium]|nr:hypothetical protein [Gemmatimonadaceae bacterium]